MEYISHSPTQTRAFAAQLARKLPIGTVLGLDGPLGAGKTSFVQGVAEALGVTEPVVSPTFSILCVYQGSMPLVHMDAYRIDGPDDLESTGFFDYLDNCGLLAVEWSSRIAGMLPAKTVWINIRPISDNKRIISVSEGVL